MKKRVRLIVTAVTLGALSACSARDVELAQSLTGGNVARGEEAFHRLGCGACHDIDGDRTTQGHVGPSLDEFALQSYLPGGLVNEPRSLMRWIRFPRQVVPTTAMPTLNVSPQDARDLAAYLYTQR